jgi:hypothetical protein
MATPAKVAASDARTPNSRLCINRVRKAAPRRPAARPAEVSLIPCPITIARMFRGIAPSAIRIPISSVDCVTR